MTKKILFLLAILTIGNSVIIAQSRVQKLREQKEKAKKAEETTAPSDDSKSRVQALRDAKKNKQLNDEVFNDNDEDFSITAGPEKWNGESAVILCQKFFFSYVEKGASRFEYKETTRRRILINDDAALEYFSIYYYKDSYYSDDKVGIKIIKPDGTEEEVNMNSAVEVGVNEIPDSYRTFYSYGTKYKKLAIPNLEKGDIIDYYQLYKSERKPLDDYAFERFTFTLAARYPVVKQKFFFNVDKKFSVSFRSFNGAPELVEGEAGMNRHGKVKEDIRTYSLEDSDREKYQDENWKMRYIEDATVKFQVFYIPQSQYTKVTHFVNEEGLLTKSIDLEEIRKRLLNNDGVLKSILESDKFAEMTVAYINRSHREKSALEKMKIAYYYLRYKNNKSLTSSFSSYYLSSYNLDANREYFVDDILFANTMDRILTKLKIDHQYVVAVKKEYGGFEDVLFPQELTVGIKAEDKYIFAFSQYSTFDYIPPNILGSEAILYKFMPTRYKTDPILKTTIPNSTHSIKLNDNGTNYFF